MQTRYSYICRIGDQVVNTHPQPTPYRTRKHAMACFNIALRDGLITQHEHLTGVTQLQECLTEIYKANISKKIDREPIPSRYVVDPNAELEKVIAAKEQERIAELRAACPAYIKHKLSWIRHQLLKDDPAFRAHRREVTKAWYARDRQHAQNVSRRSKERIANGTSRPKAPGTKLRDNTHGSD